ncbi:hypothetical protein SAMN05428959_10934 [Duganella sp. CF517]|uniref:hypothetical protein n=1 Tax=Duganella sp. CF517 TaxID=1881038 RepID=UPI0008C908E5|nr:hypothetical protein [Duganella sp. CF517]SEO51128.1 hypothetical protein SAMN05428959_10934 [Duganella sp. CF517]
MKKYLFAGLLATTLLSPAFAQGKYAAESPEQPLPRRTVVASMALLIVLGLAKRRLTRPSKTRMAD